MISHLHIAKRFKAGESIERIAIDLAEKPGQWSPPVPIEQYVQHAIRQVLRRQKGLG